MPKKRLSKRRYLTARKNISGLIRLALADLRKCEASPDYKIDMDEWHQPNSHCAVCLAGSVIAQTLNAPKNEPMTPCDFNYIDGVTESLVFKQLSALNTLREGHAEIAWLYDLELPGSKYPLRKEEYAIPRYEDSPAKFHRAMEKLAERFEKAGY